MFVRVIFPGILIAIWSFSLPKCSAQEERVVYTSDGYWNTETSLQCYDCNSAYDPGCKDPFQSYSIGIVNCSQIIPPEHLLYVGDRSYMRLKPTVCRKIVQKVENHTRIIRECGYIQDDRDDKSCAKRTGTKNIDIIYCACTKSLCNAGFNMRSPLFNIGIASFLIMSLLL